MQHLVIIYILHQVMLCNWFTHQIWLQYLHSLIQNLFVSDIDALSICRKWTRFCNLVGCIQGLICLFLLLISIWNIIPDKLEILPFKMMGYSLAYTMFLKMTPKSMPRWALRNQVLCKYLMPNRLRWPTRTCTTYDTAFI